MQNLNCEMDQWGQRGGKDISSLTCALFRYSMLFWGECQIFSLDLGHLFGPTQRISRGHQTSMN